MCGVSCLCSVAVGGGGPPSRGVFQFLLLVFCVLCCERLRLGHRWSPVCLCRRAPAHCGRLRALRLHRRGVPVPFPAAVGGGMLVVRPGTVQARRASSARSFPRDGRPRGALPPSPARQRALRRSPPSVPGFVSAFSSPDLRIQPHRAAHAPTSVSTVFASTPGIGSVRLQSFPAGVSRCPGPVCAEGSTDSLQQEAAHAAARRGMWRGVSLSASRWRHAQRLPVAAWSDYSECRIRDVSQSGTRIYFVPGGAS